jgi:hypothetical protein
MIPPNLRHITPRICEGCHQWQPNLTPNCQKYHHETGPFDVCDGWEEMREDYECL